MSKRKVNVGLVGAGYWGRNLVRVFSELGVLKAVSDISKSAIYPLRLQYPHIKFTPRPQELIDDGSLDALVISTPASTHYEFAKKALLKGKHVFVEKPLSFRLEEAQELAQLVSKSGRILMVGHILNYHPAVVKLKELIDRGELGRIEYIYSNRLNIGKLRREENILWSFAPHDISVILMLLGEYPSKVGSFGGTYLQKNIYDTTLTILDFKSGVKAHVFVSWLHPFKEQKLVVVGNKKMALFDDLTQEKLFLYPHKIEWKGRVPVAQKAEREAVRIKNIEPLRAECQHFLKCIASGSSPKTDVYEGLRVLEILVASQNSLENEGRVIVLDRRGQLGRDYFVHPSSFVDEGVEIGGGTQIWHFSHIIKGSKIGKNCKIGQNVVIGPNVRIGDGCKVQNNVSIYEGITLEDNVFCGPSCVFTNVYNPRSEIPRMKELKATLVKKGSTIGANATIVCGNTLGSYSFIGAGAVVTKDVPDYALVYGNPAQIKGWMCECGVKLEFKKTKAVCKACRKEYRKTKGKVARIR